MTVLARDVAADSSLVRLAAAGDRVAFTRLVAAYHADMVRVAYVVSGGDQGVADDAAQSAWAIAWRKLGSIRDPERLKPWLLTVAANEARQAMRRQHRATIVEIDVVDRERNEADPAATSAGELDLAHAIRHLSADDRSLLALRYAVGLDSAEIGTLTGRPAATVRWRLARLLARLRKELSDA
jgi:RNA polymerase sigma-70 factor (ECF subfamily)